MKKSLTILSLILLSVTSFAAEKAKTVTCNVSLSGGNLRADAEMEPQTTVLKIDSSDVQTGSIKLFVGPKTKQNFSFTLNTGVAPGLEMSTNIGATEITVLGDKSAELLIRNNFLTSIYCKVN